MKNILKINGYSAKISFDSDREYFRGEFIDINGYADFYATDIKGLYDEGEKSLSIFLKACEEDGISPDKSYSGKFILRMSPQLHSKITTIAISEDTAINNLLLNIINKGIKEYE